MYLKFKGSNGEKLFFIQTITFKAKRDPATSIFGDNSSLFNQYKLEQNYPNPFNPETIVQYSVPIEDHISLKVYDLLGREVVTLFEGNRKKGKYQEKLNGSNLTSGVYIYRFETSNFMDTKKMLLIK